MSKGIVQTNAVIESILHHDFRNGSGLARYNQRQPLGPYRQRGHNKNVTFKQHVRIIYLEGHEYRKPMRNLRGHKFIDFSFSNLIKSTHLNVSLVELFCCSANM